MEHLIIKKQDDGFYSIRAEEGYAVFSIALGRIVDEAVVEEKNIDKFIAVEVK